MLDDAERQERLAAAKRYERKKTLLFVATAAAPLAAYWLGFGELGPYIFAFLLVVSYAHIVDREIDAAIERARGL